MQKNIEMELPSLPNFIRAKETMKGQERSVIDVADFSDEELREIGKEWTEALIEHARERRSDRGEEK